MTWSYKENEYMYTINGVCMQVYRWSTHHNTYELCKMICLSKAKQCYPDIYELYQQSQNPITINKENQEEKKYNLSSLYDKINTWHINRDS